jgi:DNA polymerase-3 subunit chi
MTARELGFYHLTQTPIVKALPKLLEKVIAAGHKVVFHTRDATRLAEWDDILWTYGSKAFLPHGTAKDPYPEAQPVFLTTSLENPAAAKVIMMEGGSFPLQETDTFPRGLMVFDGQDAMALAEARSTWKAAKAHGIECHYWKQQVDGSWQNVTV